jgi:nitroimidazol reductase NimA-like FMN-containing flavoprotein (pyridoxamine 5'-phosphate oxidase superfamily)
MELQMSTYEVTERTRVRRIPERGTYDRETVHKILDEAILCHVGVAINGKPRVIPTAILRMDEFVYIHGSSNSQLLNSLIGGAPASIAVSFVDSLVASRSGFNCAVDYRSVVIFSDAAEEVTDPAEKERLLDAFVQHLIPGHKVRPPKRQEIGAVKIIRFPLIEVSAKIRDTGVKDFEEDYVLDLWAGRIPLRAVAGPPESCSRVKSGIEVPAYAANFERRK